MKYAINTFEEIAAKFDLACSVKGMADAELAKAVGCAQATISRVRNGISEPAVRTFALACSLVDKHPNEILLRTQPAGEEIPAETTIFTDKHKACFTTITSVFEKLLRLCPETTALEHFTDAFVEVYKTTETIVNSATKEMPKGPIGFVTKIKTGEHVAEPVPKAQRHASDNHVSSLVSEPTSPYGDKRKRRHSTGSNKTIKGTGK